MAQKKIDTNTLLIIGAAGLGLYIVFKPIKALFDTFGITQSAASQAIQQQQTSGQKSPFSPLFWRSIRNAKLMQQKLATAKAKVDEAITYGQDLVIMGHVLAAASAPVTWAETDHAALLDYCLLKRAQGLIDGVGSLSEWKPLRGVA